MDLNIESNSSSINNNSNGNDNDNEKKTPKSKIRPNAYSSQNNRESLDIDEALSMTTPSRKELFELHDRLI